MLLSEIETYFGPAKIIFFAVSIPNPLNPIINIFKLTILSMVSFP